MHVPSTRPGARARRRSLSILLAAALAGCAADPATDAEIAATEAALVTTGPYRSSNHAGSLPSLGTTNYADGDRTDTRATTLHDTQWSGGPDLGAAGRLRTTGESGAFVQEVTYAATVPTVDHMATPHADEQLLDALASADAHCGELDAGGIEHVFETSLDDLPGDISVHSSDVEHRLATFTPARARFMRSRWVTQPGTSTYDPPYDTLISYPDPTWFDEMRARAGRLYCSAREMRQRMGGAARPMGRIAAAEVNILGQPIEFMRIEPRFSLSNPELDDVGGNGSSAVTVPMLLGTMITPIHGIGLPGLPEIRIPASYVGLDSEVRNGSNVRAIANGGVSCWIDPFTRRFQCARGTTTAPEREYDTITNAGAFVFPEVSAGAEMEVPIFTLGVVEVALVAGLEIAFGDTDFSPSGPEPLGIQNDRVYTGGSGLRVGRERPLFGAAAWHDGFWGLSYLPPGSSGASPGGYVWRANHEVPWQAGLESVLPVTWTRAEQSDDHAVSFGSTLEIHGGLVGEVGAEVGGVQIEASARATLGVAASQAFDLAEGLVMSRDGSMQVRPEQGLSVSPRTLAQATFDGLDLELVVSFDVGIFTFRFRFHTRVVEPVTLASWDTRDRATWGEETRVRMGATGRPMNAWTTSRMQPSVLSHLPGEGAYETFATQTLNSCLAAPELDLPDPPACDGRPPQGTLPSAEICLHSQPQDAIPYGLCGVDWNAVYGAPYGECMNQIYAWLCEGVSREQPNPDHPWAATVARVLPRSPDAIADAMRQLGDRVASCGMSSGDLNVLVSETLAIGVCRADATLLTDGEIFGPTGSSSSPPAVVPADPCP